MKSGILVALALAFVMSVTSVSSEVQVASSQSAVLSSDEPTLRIGLVGNVDSLNPLVGMNDASKFFRSLVYDSLFSVGDDLESVGDLAVDWRIVPETDPELIASGEVYGSVWEYDITRNAKWHDGTDFTAEDAEWVLDIFADNTDGIWSSQPYAEFMQYADLVDSDTVRIHFYDSLSGESKAFACGDSLFIPMIPRHKLSEMDPLEFSFSWNGIFEGEDPPVIGTGPFIAGPDIYDEFLQGDQLTLLTNWGYHRAADMGESVKFAGLVIRFFDDSAALASALEDGEVDVARLSHGEYVELGDRIESGGLSGLEMFDGLTCAQTWTSVAFNMDDGWENRIRLDPSVRRAFAMATDKESVVDTIFRGLAEPGSTIISPMGGDWHYEPTSSEVLKFDPDAAAELLNDSGYIFTVASPTVRVASADSYAVQEGLVYEGTALSFELLVCVDRPDDYEVAEYLVEAWSSLGVDVQLVSVDLVTMMTAMYMNMYDMAITRWSSDPDPNLMLYCQSAYSVAGWSDNAYSNASYDENYSASLSALDAESRKTHVHNCQRIHYLDVGHIVLAYHYQTYAWRTGAITGWGDWEEDPGRSLDACWGANPLLFDLVYSVDLALEPYEREGSFRVMVPANWEVAEDEVLGNSTFDLVVYGPAYEGYQTIIGVDSESVRGVKETREYLESEMTAFFDDAVAEGIAVTSISDAVYWQGTNYSALRFVIEWDSLPIVQDVTLYADSESAKGWVLVSTVHSGVYDSYSQAFEQIAESMDVVEGDLVPLLELIAMFVVAAVVIAAVAIIAYVVISKRRRASATPPPPPPAIQGPVQPGTCPSCGSPVPSGGAFCQVCGQPVPPPPQT